ncbi:MAG: cysteine desulfurase [Clostridia bacterium]|nr:cysteine desulfurase [Clostridia bacterium]
MIYFDNSATTPPAPEVIDTVTEYMKESFGNPSSRHMLGLQAEKIVSDARRKVSQALSCSPDEIYFTSGGTESDNIAILGSANIKKGKRIITTSIEHPAVLRTMEYLQTQGFEVIKIKPQSDGTVSFYDIADAITPDTVLLSIMHVNNETGAVMPIDKIGSVLKRIAKRALFHVDAVQSFGHISVKPSLWGIDLLSVSSHKIHGPKGIGALYIRKGVTLKPSVFGGGQEKNIRSGTENVGGIAGFGKACELINLPDGEKVSEIKEYLRGELLKIDSSIHNGGGNGESPYILNISFGKIRSEIMLNALSAEGIYVSSGSACASGSHGSHVLSEMNVPLPDSAIRFSLSRYNTMDEAKEVAYKVTQIAKTLRV